MSTIDPKVSCMATKMAKKVPEEQRGLMQTLLALGVPVERAAGLVALEISNGVKGTLAQYAWMIREHRAKQFPEGSEVRRRLEMVADMIDPGCVDPWDFSLTGGER